MTAFFCVQCYNITIIRIKELQWLVLGRTLYVKLRYLFSKECMVSYIMDLKFVTNLNNNKIWSKRACNLFMQIFNTPFGNTKYKRSLEQQLECLKSWFYSISNVLFNNDKKGDLKLLLNHY